MKPKTIKLIAFRKFGGLRIASFDTDFSDIKIGQFLLAYHPEKDDRISPIYFVSKIDDVYFSIPEDSKWEIGDYLIFKGLNSDKPKPKRESRTRYGLPEARETG